MVGRVWRALRFWDMEKNDIAFAGVGLFICVYTTSFRDTTLHVILLFEDLRICTCLYFTILHILVLFPLCIPLTHGLFVCYGFLICVQILPLHAGTLHIYCACSSKHAYRPSPPSHHGFPVSHASSPYLLQPSSSPPTYLFFCLHFLCHS